MLQQARNPHTPVSPTPASPLYNLESSRVIAVNPNPGFAAGLEGPHVWFGTAGQTAPVSQTLVFSQAPRYPTANHNCTANLSHHYLAGNVRQNQDDARVESEARVRRTRVQQTPGQSGQAVPSSHTAHPGIITTGSAIQYRGPFWGVSSQPDQSRIPIGRQVITDGNRWECMWGSSETDSSVSTEREPCSQRCDTLDILKIHFASQHAPFHDESHMWRCMECGFDWIDPSEWCLQCGQFSWQTWYWAEVSISSKPTPPLLLRVAPDKDTWNHSVSMNQSVPMAGAAGGYNSPFMFSYGGYGNVSGTSQSFKAASAAASESSQQPYRVDCLKSSLDNPMRCQGLIAKTLGHASTAIPGFVAATLFILMFLESLPSASRSCVGQSNAVSCIVDNYLPSLSVAFIVAGLMAPWLVRQIRARLREHPEAPIGMLYPSRLFLLLLSYGWPGY